MARAVKTRSKGAVRKPRQDRSRATRDAILKAAAQLLSRRGYAALTTNHVAERAGVSVGSVYEYFRSKDAIVLALLDAHLSAGELLFAEHTRELVARSQRPGLRTVVAVLVEAMLAFHADDPRLHRVLSSEVPRSRAIDARIAALEARAVALLAAVIAAEHGPRVDRPELVARLIVETVDALTHRWILDPSGEPVPVDQLCAELTRMLDAYLLSYASR
jgi:AcrR family transcriptional regulator